MYPVLSSLENYIIINTIYKQKNIPFSILTPLFISLWLKLGDFIHHLEDCKPKGKLTAEIALFAYNLLFSVLVK